MRSFTMKPTWLRDDREVSGNHIAWRDTRKADHSTPARGSRADEMHEVVFDWNRDHATFRGSSAKAP
jgi:hypothetical protein